MDDNAVRADLLARIAARRAGLSAFLRQQVPRSRRRTTATIVLTSLAAAFTAGPAIGGSTFSGAVQQALGLQSDTPVWRVLCLLALGVSIGAAVLTNLNKSQDAAGRITTAEAANTELEGLGALLSYGRIPVPDAVQLYQQYIAKVSFVPDLPGPPGGYRVALLPVPPPR